ncbi:hypothetical protein PGT21_022792 [Puccinia graminis f. sp. tritici]|uniref:Uncharacterized protein n=1 Tax=Puccinia graminis f. sp. tritici TaxID=56615 RepID=A0A5B0QIZ1_PUCGR|nr:hypothetical protein PGT21_022792 [Puccinia graminis f. sp. tritici]
MKRRCSSSGEPRGTRPSKRLRSKSHSEPRQKQSQPIDSAAKAPAESQDEGQAPTEAQEGAEANDNQALEEVVDKRITQGIRRYERDDHFERDLWDTLMQLAHQQSQNLSRSLVHWGRKGGLRDTRTSKSSANKDPKSSNPAPENLAANTDESQNLTYDPTATSFTLWPLPTQACPIPEWTLNEELCSLVTRINRERSRNEGTDSPPIDHELEDEKAQSLADQNQKTLMQLLNDLYEFHPPHTSSIPIYTRGKTYRKLDKAAKNKSKTDQLTDPKNEKEVDFGLNWEFVLGVASSSTFDIKESVLQRARERLTEMYRVTSEPANGQATDDPLQPSQAVSDPIQHLQRYREMKPLALSSDESSFHSS